MLQVLDAAAVRRWCLVGRQALAAAREEIDGLNVYPVADGDTGTNLLLTMEAVEQYVRESAADPADPDDLAGTAGAMSSGALLGARGNSGVILSQVLRGLAEVLAGPGAADGDQLARGLARAAELACAAVAVPVEGTLLTVARAAADGAGAVPGGELAQVVAAARRAAEQCLARTPEMLPALRDAGVVDAGGRGLCVLLEALEAVVTGRELAAAPAVADREPVAARETGSTAYAYEVQYLLSGTSAAALARLREVLGGLGDSLAVVGDASTDGLVNVHVHVDDVGAALEAGVEAGRPSRISVTRFADQAAARTGGRPGGRVGARSGALRAVRPRAVVAVADGDGLGRLLARAGARVVDAGGSRPSTGELLAAVRAAGAREVVLLPDDREVHGPARAAAAVARQEGVRVAVVPACAPVQGLAALAVADPARDLDDDVAAMSAAAHACRWGSVTTASRTADTAAGPCLPGDALGLQEGRIVLVGVQLPWVARRLVDRLLARPAEVLTLVLGRDAPHGLAADLARHVGDRHPAVEVTVVDGGQPHCALLLGAE